MKRLNHKFRKGLALLLILAMVAGLVPAMSGGANKVQAASGSGTEPSVSAYATKAQLMDGTFDPDSGGNATNIGKLVFGKNQSGTAQEWYILGKDEGVSGDNTIIFAASPIATNQVFNSSTSTKTYDYEAGTGYEESAGRTTVYANHYGASELRVALQSMAMNTSYFTTAEQGLMNATTVTTKDTMNSNVTYTTTDKLYALQGDFNIDKKLWAGTSDSTVLAKSSYWSSGDWFWLRSPRGGDSNYALLAYPGVYVSEDIVYKGHAVQPASNLNLSSVLFASSAKAASSDTVESGTIASGTAMTLRLNGTGKNIGTVTYNTTTGDIKVAKGSTSQTVALIVQGKGTVNGEEKDWYYSKQITGTEVVNVTDIVSETNTPASINLSTCKIWLEITDTDGLIYAVGATEILSITSVAITDIETPAPNTSLDTGASCVTEGVSSTTPQITWTPSDSTAGYNTSYTASVTLTAGTGYEFIDSTTANVNGNTATNVTKNADGTLTVTYAFPATKDKLTSITAPQAITVANGTAYSAMNLPATVNIVTEGNTVSSASVTWNTTTPENGSYDPAVLTQQTVTLTGTVTCPDSINANGVELTTTITITISAAGIVGAPTANPTAGTYTENQSVTLTSSTEGATIYYTTDGSEPTITGGVPGGTTAKYTAPIAVTGTEGQSITTTIKAIAVKNGMQDSSVETFTYTIQTPDVPDVTAPSITTQPGNATVKVGETATFTLAASGTALTYQWQIDRNDGNGWVNIAGANEASYTTPTVNISCSGFKYQCVVSNSAGTVTSNTAVLTVTENIIPDPDPVDYEILDGANSNWEQNSDGSLSIRGSGAFSKFVGVKVDGTLVDAKNYTVKEGSTIVTLKADYLNTVSAETHTFEILWTDGSASTTFTIKADSSDNGNNNQNDNDNSNPDDSVLPDDSDKKVEAPKTGDDTPSVWLFILTIISGTGLILTTKKRRKNLKMSEK